MAIKWEETAQEMGYKSVKDMLENLYHTKRMTSVEIGHLFKINNETVCRKMKKLGLSIRPAGARSPKDSF
jgi:hypothetical protein